ncbi:hypothetical protein M9458_029757, partial [Cirrhinus mrigala]
MSGETEPKPYLYRGVSEEGESESLCGSMSHLHRMGGASEGSDSSHDPPTSPRPQTQMHEDMEMVAQNLTVMNHMEMSLWGVPVETERILRSWHHQA